MKFNNTDSANAMLQSSVDPSDGNINHEALCSHIVEALWAKANLGDFHFENCKMVVAIRTVRGEETIAVKDPAELKECAKRIAKAIIRPDCQDCKSLSEQGAMYVSTLAAIMANLARTQELYAEQTEEKKEDTKTLARRAAPNSFSTEIKVTKNAVSILFETVFGFYRLRCEAKIGSNGSVDNSTTTKISRVLPELTLSDDEIEKKEKEVKEGFFKQLTDCDSKLQNQKERTEPKPASTATDSHNGYVINLIKEWRKTGSRNALREAGGKALSPDNMAIILKEGIEFFVGSRGPVNGYSVSINECDTPEFHKTITDLAYEIAGMPPHSMDSNSALSSLKIGSTSWLGNSRLLATMGSRKSVADSTHEATPALDFGEDLSSILSNFETISTSGVGNNCCLFSIINIGKILNLPAFRDIDIGNAKEMLSKADAMRSELFKIATAESVLRIKTRAAQIANGSACTDEGLKKMFSDMTGSTIAGLGLGNDWRQSGGKITQAVMSKQNALKNKIVDKITTIVVENAKKLVSDENKKNGIKLAEKISNFDGDKCREISAEIDKIFEPEYKRMSATVSSEAIGPLLASYGCKHNIALFTLDGTDYGGHLELLIPSVNGLVVLTNIRVPISEGPERESEAMLELIGQALTDKTNAEIWEMTPLEVAIKFLESQKLAIKHTYGHYEVITSDHESLKHLQSLGLSANLDDLYGTRK